MLSVGMSLRRRSSLAFDLCPSPSNAECAEQGQAVLGTEGNPKPWLSPACCSEILCPTSVNPALWRNHLRGPFNVLASKISSLPSSPTAGDEADVPDTAALGSLETCPAGEGRQEGLKQAQAHGKHGTVLETCVQQPWSLSVRVLWVL